MLIRGSNLQKNLLADMTIPNTGNATNMASATNTIIDNRYNEGKALIDFLLKNKELSLSTDVENNFRKTLLLSTASYFEHQITEILREFAKIHSQNNSLVMEYIEKQGISRKYHTLFSWESGNVNSFLGNFGSAFKTKILAEFKANSDLEVGAKAFIEIGSERNNLVHRNFADFPMEKTADEIHHKYKQAIVFIHFLKEQLTTP
jgi:hypothetical protein